MKLVYKIALSKIPNVGPSTAKQLVSYCGGIEAVFKEKKKALLNIPGIGEIIANSILDKNYFEKAEQELKYSEKNNIRIMFYLDENYPARLKHHIDSPVVLYYKGDADLNHDKIIGIVGTRQATDQGKHICEVLVQELGNFKPLIVSGLAYGIDICAHTKCLRENIPTVGVLGNGFSLMYPQTNQAVAKKMVHKGGLLTEFGYETLPERENFPMRNRIIAQLSDALVVVESKIKGGSMITAYLANEYNKDVFAVPGRIKDELSAGCNHLIKTHKAALITSAADIGYIMRWDKMNESKNRQTKLFNELTEDEKIIVNLLDKTRATHIEEIISKGKFPVSRVSGLLLNLEFKGLVKTMPGKKYILY